MNSKKKVEIKCEGIFSNFSPHQLREIYGMAIKYILKKKDWDYQGDINFRKNYAGRTFEETEYVKPMKEQFKSRTKKLMGEASDLNECLKELVHYKYGLKNPKLRKRIRRKRIRRLYDEFCYLMKRYIRSEKPCKGLFYFAISIREQFITKKEAKNERKKY